MRTVYIAIFCVLGILVIFYPLEASGEEDIDGVWAFDVTPTVALMREGGGLPAPLPDIEKTLSRTRITIDGMHKVFRVTEAGKEMEKSMLVMISRRGDVITLHRRQKAEAQFRFLEDGRLMGLEGGKPAFVLRRVE